MLNTNPVAHYTHTQLHTFLDELKNGTRQYRTIESVLRQVTAEYRGRAVIELLQNAHDALLEGSPDDPRRVAFVLHRDPRPVLLVANTGAPIRKVNFEGIAALGQSPKDPNVSVGNKGLGFRSVLNVCTCPEVWSTPSGPDEPTYRFRFDPRILDDIVELLDDLLARGHDTQSPFLSDTPLVDWTPGNLAAFRQRMAVDGALEEACGALSAYGLPLPVGKMPQEVEDLLESGFSTVVRLPLDGGPGGDVVEAVTSLENQLAELGPRALVFLENLRSLEVRVEGAPQAKSTGVPNVRLFRRSVEEVESRREGALSGRTYTTRRVRIRETLGSEPEATWLTWTRDLGGADDEGGRAAIQTAVAKLPNRWPELERVTVSLATRVGAQPEQGAVVIFLPTTVHTTGAALLNAPFYGSLDRRSVKWSEKINTFLLDELVRLAIDAVDGLVAGEASVEAMAAVLDLITSTGSLDGSSFRWMDKVRSRLASAPNEHVTLERWPVLGTSAGWRAPGQARLSPRLPDDWPLDEATLRGLVQVPLLHPSLESRVGGTRALLVMLQVRRSLTDQEWLELAEAMCRSHVESEQGLLDDWHALLDALRELLPKHIRDRPTAIGSSQKTDLLAQARILPTSAGLRSASGRVKVFFRRVRGAHDEGDGDLAAVPERLQDRVAFLHEEVRTREGGAGSPNTQVQRFLDGRVATYDTAELLRSIAIRALPKRLPVAHGTEGAALCRDVLQWGLALAGDEPKKGVLDLLKRLPVPTAAGWAEARGLVFGPGWEGPLDAPLSALSKALPSEVKARVGSRLLLAPSDKRWPEGGAPARELLARMGVIDHWPLVEPTQKSEWMMGGYSQGSFTPPRPWGFAEDHWSDWQASQAPKVNPYYGGEFSYELLGLRVLELLPAWSGLENRGREAFSEVVLASLPAWGSAWRTSKWNKTERNSDSGEVESPLAHWMRTRPWLVSRPGATAALSQRWFIPPERLAGRRHTFAHLNPLGLDLARRLNQDSEVRSALEQLSLGAYPSGEARTDARLLEALAECLDAGRIAPAQRDVFLGQVREGWHHLRSDADLPRRVVVQLAPREFETQPLRQLHDAYVPDNVPRTRVLMDLRHPVIPMRPQEAAIHGRRLAEFGGARMASALRPRVLADGALVDGRGGEPLQDSDLAWLPVLLLSIHAYGGRVGRGHGSRAWREARDRLKAARVQYCGVAVQDLVYGDDSEAVAQVEVAAAWVGDRLLVIGAGSEEDSHERMAGALQAALGRGDLLKDLRFALGSLPVHRPPSSSEIEEALHRCEIEAPEVHAVRAEWMGRSALVVDRLQPLLVLLEVEDQGLASLDGSQAGLLQWAETRIPGDLPVADMVDAALRSRDDTAMGRRTSALLGERAELPAWNQALRALDRPEVWNERSPAEVVEHLQAAKPLLRAVKRHEAKTAERPALYRELELSQPSETDRESWARAAWSVPLDVVLHATTASWPAPIRARVPAGPVTAADLRGALEDAGIALSPDPDDIARKNLAALKGIAQELAATGGAWLRRNIVVPEDVRAPDEAWLDPMPEQALLSAALDMLGVDALTSKVGTCSTIKQVRQALKVTIEEVEAKRAEAKRAQEAKDRKRRTFDVAGTTFVLDDDAHSFGDLLERIEDLPPPGDGPDPLAGKVTPLGTPPKIGGGGSGGGGATGGGGGEGNETKHLKRVVGVLGEMHAYRWLRGYFGESAVPATAWVSEIRKQVLPPLPGEAAEINDNLGYDFRIRHSGLIWKVEVKASSHDATSFRLGSTQVREATLVAGRSNEVWAVLRIRQALSKAPVFEWLSNPFEAGGRALYAFSRASMMVSYRPK